MYKKYIKRILDFTLALILLLLLSPVFLIIAILVLIFHGRPIIFTQERTGYKEETFDLYKFRSMTNEKDENGELLPSKDRITKFGSFLRKTSLDELPEIFNILIGDMSFIGPRPVLVRYLKYYEDRERLRHEVKPGLTGLSQVNGRNRISWRKRFEYDVYYVENISFLLDVKIFIDTIKVVLSRKGIADVEETKVDEFGPYILYKGEKFRAFDKEREYEWYLEEKSRKESDNHE